MTSSGKNNDRDKCPSDELLKTIDLWLKWDQCEETRKQIEQLKVVFSNGFILSSLTLCFSLGRIEMG